jgi:N utilization substance protein B
VQFLFGLEFTRYDWHEPLAVFWVANPVRPGVQAYAERLVRGVSEHRDQLDKAIAGALEKWSPERVGRVERNVLRVALYEMKFEEDVPDNVAINEAIEVTKMYCGEDTAGFVNGVLERLKAWQPEANDT